MLLGKILFCIGLIITMAYLITICAVVVCECTGNNHPSEKAVEGFYIRVAIVYAVIVGVYLIGHVGA